MKDELDELKQQWLKGRIDIQSSNNQPEISELVRRAKKRSRFVTYSHYWNIAILTIVLVMICAFFYYVAPFRDLLSHLGVALMTGGLAIRIAIEVVSSTKSRKIDLTDHAAGNTNKSLAFYQFRKRIHGPVTKLILVLYTIGFYILTPEFSKYLSTTNVILIDASYVFFAIFIIYSIRMGIRKELGSLNEMIELQKEIHQG